MPADPSTASLDATLRDFVAGQKVFGRYTLTRILGRGGMGIVWLTHDDDLDRDVALKFLPEIIVHDRAIVEDLKRETKRALELTHKNIIRIHDFVHDSISACITMEYVEGDTLSNLRVDKATRAFEPDEIKPWLSQLCDALDYAHNHARIVHRDLKPSNLMITKRGQLKIADFGIACTLTDSVSMITHSTGTSGTLFYMSPQQLDGHRATHLDDIYSVGATLYELLTSKPPFYSGDIQRQIHERIPPSMMRRRADLDIEGNPIPKNWEETVANCLAKDPAKRPQTVTALAQRLHLAETSEPTFASTKSQTVKSARRMRSRFAIAAAIAIIAVAGAVLFERNQQRQQSNQGQIAKSKPSNAPTASPPVAAPPAVSPSAATRARRNPSPLEHDLHFTDGRVPNGWRIVVYGPGQNASIKNGQFQADQVDTYAGLRTAVELDASKPLVIEYTGNVADVYWGMGEQARLLMTDGTIITAGLGKAGYGGKELSAGIGNSRSPQFTKALPPKFGVYRVKAKFENGRVSCSAIQWGKGTLFEESIAVPELELREVSEIELFAFTTTGESAWVRDVTIYQ